MAVKFLYRVLVGIRPTLGKCSGVGAVMNGTLEYQLTDPRTAPGAGHTVLKTLLSQKHESLLSRRLTFAQHTIIYGMLL